MADYFFYPAIALTGGTDGALDSYEGSSLTDGSAGFVVIPATGAIYIYTLDADSGATESSPNVIAPDSNAGNKRWLLVNSYLPSADGTLALPGMAFGADLNTGIYRVGADSFALVVGGVEAFRLYKAGTGYRFGAPEGINGAYPVFEVLGDLGQPKVYCRSLIMGDPGDTPELAFRVAAGDPDAAVPYLGDDTGQQMALIYWQGLGTWSDDTPSFYGQYKAIRPIKLAGAAPTFTGSFKCIASGKSGYDDGMRYHVELPAASGTNPTVNLNGWGAKSLLRANGDAPAVDYWDSGAEVTLVYSTASGGRFLADTDSGSDDGGAGRTTDVVGVNPFFSRTACISARMGSAPTGTSREGILVFRTTPPEEIVERERLWISSIGSVVAAGRSSYEDDLDAFNYYRDESYPGQLTQSGTDITDPPNYDFVANVSPGPSNPVRTAGWANISVPASDASRFPAIGIRKATAHDRGLDITYDHTNDRVRYTAVHEGAGGAAQTITGLADNGRGNARVTIASHGYSDLDVVRVAGTADAHFDGTWTIKYITANTFDLIGSTYDSEAAGGTVTVCAKITVSEIHTSDGSIEDKTNHYFGTVDTSPCTNDVAGALIKAIGNGHFSADGAPALHLNRKSSDGALAQFYQAGSLEGSIEVSGTTISYNAFLGAHWSQLPDGSRIDIPVGTVMESVDALCEWPGEQNNRLPRSRVCDQEKSTQVYGVFLGWDNEWTATNDTRIAGLGAGFVRVAAGETVKGGDLLESAGVGCAKAQKSKFVRSSTIGKVTAAVKTVEYDDGSYLVPCVLMCG